jgi:hypothetical protein
MAASSGSSAISSDFDGAHTRFSDELGRRTFQWSVKVEDLTYAENSLGIRSLF